MHVVVFFIFLVANIGGSLTPLGDPPLFLGFLKGVDFFWPTRAMFLPMLVLSLILLVIFYVLDRVDDDARGGAAAARRRRAGLPARGHGQPRCCWSGWCSRC